jgi:pyruvate/2-oxoglutarate dehydrogenase complex dihydrolipoamide dehydrogenase (E3) component
VRSAVGLELGSLWNWLGSEVTMLVFLPRIALGFDLELSTLLQRLLTAQGMTFHLETKVTAVKFDNGRATVTATKGGQERKFKADKVLVSVGRRPFSDGLGAEKVGVEFDEKRRIKVDKDFRTNIEDIYAIGDVIAGPMLAHKAENEKNCLRRNHREQGRARKPARSVLWADCDQHAPLKSIRSIQGPMKSRNSATLNTPSATKRLSTQAFESEGNTLSCLSKE